MKIINIDKVDKAIINCLQDDPRIPCSEIGRRLGYMTARGIRNRLKRLISEDIVILTANINSNVYMEDGTK